MFQPRMSNTLGKVTGQSIISRNRSSRPKVEHVEPVQLACPEGDPLGGEHRVERLFEAVGHGLRQPVREDQEAVAGERLVLLGSQAVPVPLALGR